MSSVQPQHRSLRTFAILWSGQFVSALGSEMTIFALTLWAWEGTEQATPLSLILFFTQLPKVCTAIFAGVLVDTYNRKRLMLVSDLIAGIGTVFLLLLLFAQQLQIWQIYLVSAVNGLSGYLQSLAYATTLGAIVPKAYYARAMAMDALKQASAYVFAPAIAGVLYPFVGLAGILAIDLGTFAIALATLTSVVLPRTEPSASMNASQLGKQLSFGFEYIFGRPGLLAILLFLLSSNLFASASFALVPALVLARSGNDVLALASVRSAFGFGGLLGSAALSLLGAPKPRIYGLLLGVMLPQIGLIGLALGRQPFVWAIAAFASAFFIPMLGSSNQAIWLAKVESSVQGRVFASRFLIAQLSSPVGFALAGPLADRAFEPAMDVGGILAPKLGPWLGVGSGAGIALQLLLLAACNLAIGLGGYGIPLLRNVETMMPDCGTQSGGSDVN